MTVSKRVLYDGTVQGVGFRYTTRELAGSYPIAGYVRNLADGRVEVVAEGPAQEVEAFLKALEQQMAGYIRGQEAQEQRLQGLQGFAIRH